MDKLSRFYRDFGSSNLPEGTRIFRREHPRRFLFSLRRGYCARTGWEGINGVRHLLSHLELENFDKEFLRNYMRHPMSYAILTNTRLIRSNG